MCAKHLPAAFDNPAHEEARTSMILAATYAGIGALPVFLSIVWLTEKWSL
jgi:alcohol dehydrogenase class IV